MIVQVPNVLNSDQIARCREVMTPRELDRRPGDRRVSIGRGEGQSPVAGE